MKNKSIEVRKRKTNRYSDRLQDKSGRLCAREIPTLIPGLIGRKVKPHEPGDAGERGTQSKLTSALANPKTAAGCIDVHDFQTASRHPHLEARFSLKARNKQK